MEKLIELLNEYGEKSIKSEFDVGVYLEMRTYTKKFIKWLVDNDKIDFTELQEYWDRWEMGMGMFSNMYKSDIVILTLSIQDNPIEFLISILK